MLRNDIVQIVSEFKWDKFQFSYKNDPKWNDAVDDEGECDGHYEQPTIYDCWVMDDTESFYSNEGLREDEHNLLKKLLLEKKEEDNYKVVRDYIDFCLENSQSYPLSDHKSDLFEWDLHNYVIYGIDNNHYFKVCGEVCLSARLSVFKRHYKREYFEKMLPFYVQSLRQLINEEYHWDEG